MSLILKTACQAAVAAALSIGGVAMGIDGYLKSVGASDPVRERMVGIVLVHVAPGAALGAIAGVVTVAIFPSRRRPSDAEIAARFARQQLQRHDLPPAEAEQWTELAALTDIANAAQKIETENH
ncbi:hypothetical protein [Pantanalinema sp. GBBB05]|uniref:hypothetical protein n=1 Tax=Pantanalinema sp. GBBB05 TaxID=2604139 RepID=UPI001D2FF525|nr:hypothetical protein [Pantanalinema sp. GBBB05]